MSLEAKIEALTAAVVALTAKLESSNVAPAAPVAPAPAPVVQAAPLVQSAAAAPASVIPTNPVSSQPVAPAMPAPPTFVAPAPAPVDVVSMSVPFADGKGLIDYVMGAYKALGPQKGAQIQGVLTGLGYQNINDVKPEHYAALHTGIEALKAA
jgi:hypothetical protein